MCIGQRNRSYSYLLPSLDKSDFICHEFKQTNKQKHREATVLEHTQRYYSSGVKMKKKGKTTHKMNMKTLRGTRKIPEITGTEGIRNKKNKLEMKKLLRIEGKKRIH